MARSLHKLSFLWITPSPVRSGEKANTQKKHIMKKIETPKHASKKTAEFINHFNEKLATSATLQQRRQVLLASLEKAKAAVLSDPSQANLDQYARAKNENDILLSAMPEAVQIDPGTEQRRALEQAEARLHEIENKYDAEKLASEKDEVAAYRGQAKPETIRALDEARDEVQAARDAIPKPSEGEKAAFLKAHLERPGFWGEAVRADIEAMQDRYTKAIAEGRKAFAAAITDHIMKGLPHDNFDHREPTGEASDNALQRLRSIERRSVMLGNAHSAARQRSTGAHTVLSTLEILSFLNTAPQDLK